VDGFCCWWGQCQGSLNIPAGFLWHLWITPNARDKCNLATERIKKEQNACAGWKLAGVLLIDCCLRSSPVFTCRFDPKAHYTVVIGTGEGAEAGEWFV